MDDSDLLIQAGFSTAKMEAETRKVIAKYEEAAKRSAKKFDEAMAKVSNNETLKATAREIDRLSRKYDPAYAGAKKYERGVKELNRAVEIGSIGNKEYEQGLERLVQDLERGGKGAGKFGAAMRQGSGASRSYGGALQNVGFQIGDFATQVGAGTSATQALGQQLPQLLGAFGVFGAVAGAAAAILIPLGSALFEMGSEAEDAEGQLDALSKATDAWVAAAKLAATPIEELREQFGGLAEEMAEYNKQTALLAGAGAEVALQRYVETFTGQFGSLAETGAGRGGATHRDRAVTNISDEYEIARAEAQQIADAMAAVEAAQIQGGDALVTAAHDYRKVLIDVAGSAEKAVEQFGGQFERIDAIAEQASRQREASLTKEERLRTEVMNRYLADEKRLIELIEHRGVAESELAEARASRDAEREAKARRILENIDKEIEGLRNTKGRVAEMEAQVSELQKALSYLSIDETGELKERLNLMQAQLESAKVLGEQLDDVTLKALEGQFDGVIGAATRLLQEVGLIKDDLKDLKLPDVGRFEAEYVARSFNGAGVRDQELVRAVVEVSRELGIAAKDLLAVMSFETGGTLDPWQAGPTTQWGQHRGLIQWGEPQRERYGVSESSTVTEQVRAAGQYLSDAGVKAGDGLARIYAAVLAGDARKIHASDTHNGGAVSDVVAAVSGPQFEPHKARAQGLLNAYSGDVKEIEALATAEKRAATERQRALEREATERQKLLDIRISYQDLMRAQINDAEFENSLIGKTAEEQARMRAEYLLTQEAKRRGIDLTEKIAGTEETWAEKIRQTAEELARRNIDLEKSNETLSQIEARSQAGQNALDNFFGSIFDGATSAKEAVIALLAEIAKAQFLKGIHGLFDGTGVADVLGGLLGFSSGGYTGPGGVHQPAGIVHKGEVVWSQADVVRAGGVSVVEKLRLGLPGYANGGVVGPEAAMSLPPLPAISDIMGVGQFVRSAGVTLHFAPIIDARGADAAAVQRIEENQRQMAAEFEGRVHATLRQGRNTRKNQVWGGR